MRKATVAGPNGVVASHHRVAAEIGAEVLCGGGNAVDAAIATAFAVGVAEPWMSGIGGIGAMLIREAGTGKVSVIDFGARAPARLDPAAYVLAGGTDTDLFGWPKVVDNRNLVGPYAVAIPAMVAGHAMAHELFGTKSWAELVAPAAEIAERGVQADWHTTLWIAAAFADLARDPGCRALFLPNGAPPYPPGAAGRAPSTRGRSRARSAPRCAPPAASCRRRILPAAARCGASRRPCAIAATMCTWRRSSTAVRPCSRRWTACSGLGRQAAARLTARLSPPMRMPCGRPGPGG